MAQETNILSAEEVRELMGDVLEKENLRDTTLEISPGIQKGDGYMSMMTKVKATNKNNVRHFIIKWASKSEGFRKFIPLRKIFLREIYFYEVLAPAFAKFQGERNVKEPFASFPKCYKTISEEFNETIIMEDIKEAGFKLWNRKELMDEEHVVFMLKEYGKFHAISFAMQDQDMELYKRLTDDVVDLYCETAEKFSNETKHGFDFVIDIFKNDDQDDKVERIRNALIDFKEKKLIQMMQSLKDRHNYHAVLHGDCWCNNMMFKNEDGKTTPIQMNLLDFQYVRIYSPVGDLAYAIYASAQKEIYNNLDHYLRIYHDSFSQHMNALGSNADKIYPFAQLKSDWKQFCLLGFTSATIVHRVALKDSDDVVDIADIADGDQHLSDIYTMDDKIKFIADERTRALTLHVYDSGFFD